MSAMGKIIVRDDEIIMRAKNINTVKNPTDIWSNSITPWNRQYRIEDGDIKIVNEIWKEMKDV